MSDELKPYRLNGFKFLHDSRGRYITDSGVAWLDDSRARKIFSTLKYEGNEDQLVLEVSKMKEESAPESPTRGADVPAGEDGEDRDLLSVVSVEAVLALHFKKRKKIASFLVGADVDSTKEADELIKAASVEDLAQLVDNLDED